LAGAVPRTELLLQWLAVTLLGSVVLVASGGLGLAAADALVRGDGSEIPRLVATSLAYLPGVLVLAAVATLLTGWLPRGAALAWLGLAVAFVVGWLGPVLDLPDAINAISPFDHLPTTPVESVAAGPLVALSAVAAALTVLGLIGFRRRDLT
jgi:ABC-2 type transport system permease protein